MGSIEWKARKRIAFGQTEEYWVCRMNGNEYMVAQDSPGTKFIALNLTKSIAVGQLTQGVRVCNY